MGLDGWRHEECKQLPIYVWNLRAQLDNMCESLGVWPESLMITPTTMIPKKDCAAGPLDQRPITVFSHLCRAYIGIKWQQLQGWHGAWIHPSVRGAVPRHEALECTWSIQMQIEPVLCANTSLFGGMLDANKYFDSFRHFPTLQLLSAAGLPKNFLKVYSFIYKHLKRLCKINGTFSPSNFVNATNRFAQGDSFVLMIANLSATVWARAITARIPRAIPNTQGSNSAFYSKTLSTYYIKIRITVMVLVSIIETSPSLSWFF